MKVASVRLATARAHKVLPVPGGPYNKTPFGGSIPRLMNLSGYKNKKFIIHNQNQYYISHYITFLISVIECYINNIII